MLNAEDAAASSVKTKLLFHKVKEYWSVKMKIMIYMNAKENNVIDNDDNKNNDIELNESKRV